MLVDYKGGATFDACAELPHTVGVVTDLDDRLAERALVSLEAELRRRERLLRSVGAVDLTDWRAVAGRPPLPRLVVVVDEFATLVAEVPGFVEALVAIAQRGRSLGVHLVLATQRPSGVVSDDIRANTNLRIALRVHDVADARDVVGHDAPAAFGRRVPGRTMLRLGPGEHVVFQAARSSGPARRAADPGLRVVGDAPPVVDDEPADETELAVLVHSIRNAAALCDVQRPHQPWLPALPAAPRRRRCPRRCRRPDRRSGRAAAAAARVDAGRRQPPRARRRRRGHDDDAAVGAPRRLRVPPRRRRSTSSSSTLAATPAWTTWRRSITAPAWCGHTSGSACRACSDG